MIVLQNISKYYYTDTSVTQALKKINLEFQVGEFVAITGESGSGKSTLLNIISGMDTFDDGEMYFDGQPTFQFDVSDWEAFRRDRIGFVFQNYNLIGHYSTLDNVKSALLIMGMTETEAKEKAIHYLEKVGLKGFEQQRASELSSGQKQRLSIARALAKETAIIVADEPTGNLDSETGEQIIRLLKEVSENKLVIMVTHNYDQAEPYVTRKVRLHDGEVVVDVQENQMTAGKRSEREHEDILADKETEKRVTVKDKKMDNESEEAADKEAEESIVRKGQNASVRNSEKEFKKQQNKTARIFARMNTRTQRGRALLFRIFFLFTAIVSFLFIGQLYKNADDTSTKDYDSSIYNQKNDSRLSVRKEDGSPITSKDIKKMQSVRNVVQVDQYDYANDINYYVEEDKDYKFVYGNYENSNYGYMNEVGAFNEYHSGEELEFLNKKKFMRSITCISKDDLSAGRMPENRYEIVMYSEDSKKLNTEIEIYFTADNIMGEDQYYHHKCKIVGLLKEETSQIYFHGDLCHMLSAAADDDQIKLEYMFNDLYQIYIFEDRFYFVIGDDLKYDEAMKRENIKVSKNYIVPSGRYSEEGGSVEDEVPGEDQLTIKVNTDRKGVPDSLAKLDGQAVKVNVLGEEFNDQGSNILEVSEELFNKYFPRESTQASVYIKNYTKTDQVIASLKKMGYTAVSTYRISSVNYNSEKVMDRLIFIGISLAILLVLILVEILILRAIMKIKIKDFYVLKSMGMQLGMINKISYYEMTRYCFEAMVVTVIVMLILNAVGIPMLGSMMIYYGVCAYTTFVLYNFCLECVTVWAFNRLLKGRMAS